jgi:hypothetical protein
LKVSFLDVDFELGMEPGYNSITSCPFVTKEKSRQMIKHHLPALPFTIRRFNTITNPSFKYKHS